MQEPQYSLKGTHNTRSLRQAIRRSALFFVSGIAVIAVCGLATIASEATSRPGTSTAASWKSIETANSAKATSSALDAEPLQQATALPDPNAADINASQRINEASVQQSCDKRKFLAAKSAQRKAAALEKKQHDEALKLLKSTGLFTRYFAPGMYTAKYKAEQSKHNRNMQLIARTYQASVRATHCTK